MYLGRGACEDQRAMFPGADSEAAVVGRKFHDFRTAPLLSNMLEIANDHNVNVHWFINDFLVSQLAVGKPSMVVPELVITCTGTCHFEHHDVLSTGGLTPTHHPGLYPLLFLIPTFTSHAMSWSVFALKLKRQLQHTIKYH